MLASGGLPLDMPLNPSPLFAAPLSRRLWLSGAGVATAQAWAQSPARVPRLGVLRWGQAGDEAQRGLTEALAEVGLREGSTVRIDWRFARDRALAARHAAELVSLAPDVLISSATPAGQALRDATTTIPIVMGTAADPVRAGLVKTLSHPGGNITGVSSNLTGAVPKQVQLLREMLPGLQRVGFLGASNDPATPSFREQFRSAARTLGMVGIEQLTTQAEGFAAPIDALLRERCQALVVQPLFVLGGGEEVNKLLLPRKLPAVSGLMIFLQTGGLIAYGPNRQEGFRRTVSFVNRILAGARPADLPVEEPITYELGVNQITAKVLGITVPRSLSLRADEVVG